MLMQKLEIGFELRRCVYQYWLFVFVCVSVCLRVLPDTERFILSSAWVTSARQAHAARRSKVKENLQTATESHDKHTFKLSGSIQTGPIKGLRMTNC